MTRVAKGARFCRMTVMDVAPVATPLIVRRASRVVDEWREGFSGRLNAPKQIQSTGMSCILVYPT